jgi:putative ABC transport system permease protein
VSTLALRAGGQRRRAMGLAEALAGALSAIAANPLRAALTMLGIVIGTAAVIATVAVGSGAREVVLAQIRSLGSNLIIILPGAQSFGGVRTGTGFTQTLTYDDATAILREVPAVALAVPGVRSTQQVVAGGVNWSTGVQGTTLDLLAAREWDLAAGRPWTPEEEAGAAKVALIGETVAASLFADADPVGAQIRIRNVPFEVIGLLARKGQATTGMDQDDVVLVPFWTARRSIVGASRANARAVGTILIKVAEGEDMAAAEEDVRALLRQRHRLAATDADDFSLRNLSEIAATRDASARTLAVLLSSVATVSLLVGGIGIMNIMLVSVTERTREIGLRLAVGARRRDILRQFLLEAVVLSLIGGLAGIALGVAAANVVAASAGWPVLIEPAAVALAVGFSALVGVAFGFYPARRAATLDPIAALRRE